MNKLSKQELHQLAMNVVGKDLEEKGYKFLGVNSEFQKDQQFVALKNKKLSFVIVRAITYPENPTNYDPVFMETMKTHASKFNAKTFFTGVGIANKEDYELPVSSEHDYVINYKGLQLI